MKNFLITALLAGLAFLFPTGSVSAQSTDATPAVEQATIKGSATHKHKIYKSFNERLVVSHLDGKTLWKPTLAFFFTGHGKYPEEIKVTPGRHYLKVHYSNGQGGVTFFADQELWLDAEAGKIYQLKADINAYTIRVWIEEADTGRVVGGIPGGEPEPPAAPAV